MRLGEDLCRAAAVLLVLAAGGCEGESNAGSGGSATGATAGSGATGAAAGTGGAGGGGAGAAAGAGGAGATAGTGGTGGGAGNGGASGGSAGSAGSGAGNMGGAAGDTSAPCAHRCDADAVECSAGRLRVCTTDGNGCRDWVQRSPCGCPSGSSNCVGSSGANLKLTPTFESLSIEVDFTDDANENSRCHVEYRPAGSTRWREGLDLWSAYDRHLYVGSVVYLAPNTRYQVRLTVEDPDGGPTTPVVQGEVTTWSEDFPIGETTLVAQTSTAMTVTKSGTATGYHLIAPPAGTRGTVTASSADRALVIDADYVIVRDIDVIGGIKNGIKVANGHHDVIIDNCAVKHFGVTGNSAGPGSGFPDMKDYAGILVGDSWSGSGNSRVVIQNCEISDPNGGANSWDQEHPLGPHGIFFTQTAGNSVIRYNRVRGEPGLYYNDCIGGAQNESVDYGFVAKDSDVYGNMVSQCWDDGIEDDGRNENVRIFGNFIEHSMTAISSSTVRVGPLYVFRNVFFNSFASEMDSNARGTAFKVGQTVGTSGPQFFFHNTVTSPHEADCAIGAAGGPVYSLTSRNNVFDVTGEKSAVYDNSLSPTNSFDHDLIPEGDILQKIAASNYAHVVRGRPVFVDSPQPYVLELAPTSQGFRSGVRIPNFGDASDGSALTDPDMGACDPRFVPLKVGRQE